MTMRQPMGRSRETPRQSRPDRPQASPEVQALIACLEEAGATLLSLPPSGFSPHLRTSALPVLREAAEAYGWSLAELKAPLPSAARISRMDRAMGYLALIPQDRYLLRRIVGCRALVHPLTGRHLFSWRRLGEALGADHKAVQRWHGDGIGLILDALRRQAASIEKAPVFTKPRVMTAMPAQGSRSLDRL